MTVVWVLVGIVLMVFGWMLFATLRLYIDTAENQYYVQLKGLMAARIVPSDDFFHIKFRIPFYTFRYNPFEERKPKKETKKKPKKSPSAKKKKKRKTWSTNLDLIKSLLATFKVKHCVIDLDTGNYPLNAKLVPVFTLLNHGPVNMRANFRGKSYLFLEIENRLVRFIKPAFKYLISK